MKEDFYTLTSWKIKEDSQEEFLYIWEKEFAPEFIKLNPYSKLSLLQSLENPNIFYSFGPWVNLEQMQAARASDKYRSTISKLVSLCVEARPGSFKNIFSIAGSK